MILVPASIGRRFRAASNFRKAARLVTLPRHGAYGQLRSLSLDQASLASLYTAPRPLQVEAQKT